MSRRTLTPGGPNLRGRAKKIDLRHLGAARNEDEVIAASLGELGYSSSDLVRRDQRPGSDLVGCRHALGGVNVVANQCMAGKTVCAGGS
jgi:hypothetical protein